MARPVGRFVRQATLLLEQLKYLGADRTNCQLAQDLEVGVSQISNYLKYLKSAGAIRVTVNRMNFYGAGVRSVRKIEVL